VTGAEPAEISRLLGQQGLWVDRLVPSRRGLEQIFLELTRDEGLPVPTPPQTPGHPSAPSEEEAR
jgi:ABC-2 type transport system ATP-binding protein